MKRIMLHKTENSNLRLMVNVIPPFLLPSFSLPPYPSTGIYWNPLCARHTLNKELSVRRGRQTNKRQCRTKNCSKKEVYFLKEKQHQHRSKITVCGGVTRPQRRVFHSDLGPGAAGGSFLGRSDAGEVTGRTAVLCQAEAGNWREGME